MENLTILNIDVEIIEFVTILPGGGWKGAAKVNGKIYTGEFSRTEHYQIIENGEDLDVEINWSELI
ncbi:hypothetical protein [Chitinophaga nivalis]|uniref:Uncharacterized protein n=1 Tax=Chitinophaga nivalis TaxID=2991709 RepID=A0ABT3IIR4_9BACT|nr:hypothetical protein [Chitinophaga nivalis]MCW3466485.1 hypothetical protein [Chitinophaga nivalis]MCW3483824.1 hypothetical protein [Chitinophaga nivalis]